VKPNLKVILAVNALIDALLGLGLWHHFVGPVPLWVWLVVAALGVGAAAFVLSRMGDSEAPRPPGPPRA
jgi:hypothetical protein